MATEYKERATKIAQHFTEQDLIDRKIFMLIQPVDNEMVRLFFEMAIKTNTRWDMNFDSDSSLIIFKKREN